MCPDGGERGPMSNELIRMKAAYGTGNSIALHGAARDRQIIIPGRFSKHVLFVVLLYKYTVNAVYLLLLIVNQ